MFLAESIMATVKVTLLCYRCGQPGHLKANGSRKSTLPGTIHGQRNTTCSQCGKTNLVTRRCRSRIHSNRTSFTDQGNRRLSMKGRHAVIQASSRLPLCDQLTGRTRGAAGMDVSTSILTSISTLKVHKVPLKAHGPTGRGLSTLLTGRSSATLQGIFMHPGITDAHFTRQIHALTTPPVTIPTKTRITQLISFKSLVPRTEPIE